MENQAVQTAGPVKRLIAIFYDSLVTFAILIAASAILKQFIGNRETVSFNPLLSLYFLSVVFAFYGWLWTHGGQTLGMKAWRIQLLQTDRSAISWQHALVRYLLSLPAWLVFITGNVIVFAPGVLDDPFLASLRDLPKYTAFSIGAVWLIIDNLKDNWRDRLSKTRVFIIPK